MCSFAENSETFTTQSEANCSENALSYNRICLLL